MIVANTFRWTIRDRDVLPDNRSGQRDRRINGCRWLIGLLSVVGCLVGFTSPAQAARSCPTEFESLVTKMLPDLPGYANRIIGRSRLDENDLPTYFLVAGRPEFEPLPLGTTRSILGDEENSDTESEVRQVFMTTLERTYIGDRTVEVQGYHWVFLTPSPEGWKLVLVFSSIGSYPADEPPTPPEDTSQGIIAQAIRQWLRNCQTKTS
jgi:hypothetical protein